MNPPDNVQAQPNPDNQKIADSIVSSWNAAQKEDQHQPPPQHSTTTTTTTTPQTAAQARTQAPPRRVCVACRRRKVGCDKKQPCQHCKKFGAECIYPSDSASTGRQALTDNQLWDQLHRLEPMFKMLADYVQQGSFPPLSAIASSAATARDPDPPATSSSAPSQDPRPGTTLEHPTPAPPTPPYSVGSTGTVNREKRGPANHAMFNMQRPADFTTRQSPPGEAMSSASVSSSTHLAGMNIDKVEGESNLSWSPYGISAGKLVKDDGRDRYVSGTFWEALHTEVSHSKIASQHLAYPPSLDYRTTRATHS